MSFFPNLVSRHRRLVLQLQAEEAKRAGITSAEVKISPAEKVSFVKVGILLAGAGSVLWYFLRDTTPIEEEKKKPSSSSSSHFESMKILESIKLNPTESKK